ncbi:MAG TPA: FdtA/QdtA family cupin domain-containing protein [Candidatus Ozemobacteraceae bacterium]|nr:FdtA/QdtA family cupin domain-containing protein [Candidatus Ozemobacteraceae bacterium]
MNYLGIYSLPKVEDQRGNLTFLQSPMNVPFAIGRVYWIYGVPGGQTRGSHAFRSAEEVMIALSGSFDVRLDNGRQEMVFHLNRSYMGVYIPRLHWRTLENFSTNSLCLVLSSTAYDATDYIRSYDEFRSLTE